jgi:hypothetical protein
MIRPRFALEKGAKEQLSANRMGEIPIYGGDF